MSIRYLLTLTLSFTPLLFADSLHGSPDEKKPAASERKPKFTVGRDTLKNIDWDSALRDDAPPGDDLPVQMPLRPLRRP